MVIWTAVIEALTCISRFGFGLQSTRDSASTIGRLTFGVRIHHGYIGIALILLAIVMERFGPRLTRWMFVAGMALFLSDMIHHFLVLWPNTGHPQFDLVYPLSE